MLKVVLQIFIGFLTIILPFIPLDQPVDTWTDYLPIRDQILNHFFHPSLWIDPSHAYRVPGYSLFLSLCSLVHPSMFLVRFIQGLFILGILRSLITTAKTLHISPKTVACLFLATLTPIYFSQQILSETLAMWLLCVSYGLQLRRPDAWKSRGFLLTLMLLTKPGFVVAIPFLIWPLRSLHRTLFVPVVVIAAWGFALKPQAGRWVFLGAGGGLNLFNATLPHSLDFQGEELDRYWLEEQRRIGHPKDLGWYELDQRLAKDAWSRFPNWDFRPARFWSPFFGRQYFRGFTPLFIPFGLILGLGFFGSLAIIFRRRNFHQWSLALVFLSIFSAHFILAPFVRFMTPLAPLAALIAASFFTRRSTFTKELHLEETNFLSAPLRQWWDPTVSWLNWRRPSAPRDLEEFEKKNHIQLVTAGNFAGGWKNIFQISRAFQIRHSHHPKSGLALWALSFFDGEKTLWLHHNHGLTTSKFRNHFYNMIDIWCARRADFFVTNCRYYQKKIGGNNGLVIPDARLRSDFPKDPTTFTKLAKENPWIVVGRLSHEKGQDWLLENAPTDQEIIFLGDGPLKERLSPRTPKHQFLGHQNPWNYFSKASVLVIPSRKEATPNVITEAIWAGIPVLAKNVGGISEILPPSFHDYQFDSGQELIGNWERLKKDPTLSGRMLVAQKWIARRNEKWRQEIWQQERERLGLPKLESQNK